MTAPLAYVAHIARDTSSRSLAGSQSSELARLTLEVVAELEASRTAGDQLRATLDDLVSLARRGTTTGPRITTTEVDRLASRAKQLLGAIRTPDEVAS